MKRMICVLLSVLLLAGICPCGAAFAAESLSTPVLEENPVYTGEPLEDGALDEAAKATLTADGYFTESKRLYRLIKKYLVSRRGTFTVPVAVKSQVKTKAQAVALVEKWFAAASDDRLAEGSTDGDYLRWAVSGMGYDAFTLDTHTGGFYCYTVQLHFLFYSTAAQEQAVDKAVRQFIRDVKPQQLSEYQLLLAAYRYIADGATYDTAAAANPSKYPASFTAYGALCGGKCACQGYCAAFYRICRALGLRVRIVSSDQKKGNHSWNLVDLGGACYFADLTWDDERFDDGEKGCRYFLVPLATLQAADSAAGEHILDNNYYNTVDFNADWRSRFAQAAYNRKDGSAITNCAVVLQEAPYVRVLSPDGKQLVKGKDYLLKYSENGRRLTVYGKGNYRGESVRLLTNRYAAAAKHGKIRISAS